MNDSWNDAWVEHLVNFDEALRLGRRPRAEQPIAAELEETEKFLVRLQSIWPRQPKKIGPYTLVRNLGQGTLGPAYHVEDPISQRPYVLKILWPDLSAHAPVRRQLAQAAESVRFLRHSSIASVREVREAGAVCLVVLEYCAGPSLAQWRRKHPHPLPWEGVTAFVAKIADTLDAAHRQGLVHGNIKPSNLFLTGAAEIMPGDLPEAGIRISDFGLARALQQARLPARSALPWPAPHFLAPEQLHQRAKPAEPANDVYALGVLLYELLTSRSPHNGATREELLVQIREAPPAPARQRVADLPEALDAIVLACLHEHPGDRPASAKHLAEALRALLPAHETPAWWKQWLGWM